MNDKQTAPTKEAIRQRALIDAREHALKARDTLRHRLEIDDDPASPELAEFLLLNMVIDFLDRKIQCGQSAGIKPAPTQEELAC